jgi:hypothetical protein
MKNNKKILMIGVLFSSLAVSTASQAAVIFQDNFNSENGGFGTLNHSSFANWEITGGTVDLIGNGFFDFYPGNGLYVDLDGSTSQAGIMSTKANFAAGTYNLNFDLGGSQRGDMNTIDVSLGSWSTSLVLNSSDPLKTFSFIFSTTGGSLTFHNRGGDNIGAIFDNVTVSTVPIPAAAWLFVSALAGLGVLSRRHEA